MQYLIAYGGGASKYETRGIPAAWLIGADGKIVWQGHPASLNPGIIEEHLKNVRPWRTFQLDPDLGDANRTINAGRYGKGIDELQKIVEAGGDDTLVAKAQSAIQTVVAYGNEELEAADSLGKGGNYGTALTILKNLEQVFKGHEIADKADEKIKAWKKDPTVKAEIAASEILAVARDLTANGKHKDAARALAQITRGKKYEGTKARTEAEALLEEVMKKL
jgi:hypothetical protein